MDLFSVKISLFFTFTFKLFLLIKLERYLGGVIYMTELPRVVILVGQTRELVAVKECLKLGIPLITVVDTNCNPSLSDLVIPANDDSVSSVSLILNELVATVRG